MFFKTLTLGFSLTFALAVHAQPVITIEQQRQAYLDARIALDAGDKSSFNTLRAQLENYPLAGYLDYQVLSKDLKDDPYHKVDDFLYHNKDSYLGHLLLRKWLDHLASEGRWHEYRSYFSNSLKSTGHQCLHLWSRYKTGDSQALEEVSTLWNVGKSQPDICDGLFEQWQKRGHMTTDIVWSRYQKALLNRNYGFARYIKNLLPFELHQQANLYQKTLRNPALLANFKRYNSNNSYNRDIVYQGLLKQARKSPDEALNWWNHYQPLLGFNGTEEQRFFYYLARDYAFDNREHEISLLFSRINPDQQIKIIDILTRELLKAQEWEKLLTWIEKLPNHVKSEPKWQYWQARANQSLGLPAITYQGVFEQLAQTRHYYGFLSADLLKQPYNLEHQSLNIQDETLKSLSQISALTRARELFILGKMHDARQEWQYAVSGLTSEQYQAAAQLAYEWGWYRKSIEALAAARSWDDLDIRFPTAFENIVREQAQETNLPPTLIFAISRQESAWESDARSSAGAMGLMQLMPATAKQTAKKSGINYRRDYLLQPEVNISLGSRYIGELLERYQYNRLPAIAAYNAGPHRVNRWLAETDNRLPHDIWVEVIPFNETRKYVQNVLSYSVVYAYHLGETNLSLLTQAESTELL